MRFARLALVLCTVVSAVGLACTPFSGTDTTTGNGTGDDGGADASTHVQQDDGGIIQMTDAGGVSNGCPNLGRGPTMVNVAGLCIDSTEISQKHFAAFFAANPKTLAGVRAPCTNARIPVVTDLVCTGQTTGPDYPATCVTTCDAELFCQWAGKHLCGPMPGSAGGSQKPTAATSEWIHSCASGQPVAGCNVASNGMAIRPVGQGCESPPGVFDLIGNASERTFSPAAGAYYTSGDSYSFTSPEGGDTCTNDDSDKADSRAADIGFRCCAAPK